MLRQGISVTWTELRIRAMHTLWLARIMTINLSFNQSCTNGRAMKVSSSCAGNPFGKMIKRRFVYNSLLPRRNCAVLQSDSTELCSTRNAMSRRCVKILRAKHWRYRRSSIIEEDLGFPHHHKRPSRQAHGDMTERRARREHRRLKARNAR